VPFTVEAKSILREYESRLVDAIKKETGTGLEAMYNRSREISMRLALIMARSMGQDEIGADAMQWSIEYVDFTPSKQLRCLDPAWPKGRLMPAVRPSIPRSKRLDLGASQRANLQEAWGPSQTWTGANVRTS
jgi:hypothetical protein